MSWVATPMSLNRALRDVSCRGVCLRAHWLSYVVAGVALCAAVAVGVAVAMHYLVHWNTGEVDQKRRPMMRPSFRVEVLTAGR
jgi:hypothetical protein